MRKLAWWLASGAAALALGCTGSPEAPTAPAGTAAPTGGSAALGAALVRDDLAMAASAIYRLDIDPATLSATIGLKQARAAQKNDDIYDLSVDAFMGPGNIAVNGVTTDGTDLTFNLTVSHPFKAPTNLDGPATAANRADLGVAMRLLFLLDADPTGNTYFASGDNVVASTGLMVNQDGYMAPKGMVDTTGLTATAFPFKNVIDELADNRVGISNGGSVTGNFDPNDGWTRATMGPTNDGWTGYGVLHQGQSATVEVVANLAAMTANGFSLDVVPVVKYNDPRQGANSTLKRANRLPPATPDSSKFGYRMPHGANDVETVDYVGENGGLQSNTVSSSIVRFQVTDWDARATESTETDLSLDPVMSNVAQGESGIPTVEVDIPGLGIAESMTLVDDDTADGGDAGADSGNPGDALYFTGTINNTATSGQPASGGTYTGLVRAADVEAGAAFNDGWRFALDGNLMPLTSNIPEPITYQSFTVALAEQNLPPTVTSVTLTNPVGGNTIGTGGNAVVTVTGLDDVNGDSVDIQVDWDNDGTFTPAGSFSPPYTTPITLTSPITYTYSGSGTDTRSVPVRYTDGTNIVTVSPTLTITINPCNPDLLVSAAFTATPFFNTGGIGVTGAVFNQSQNINPGDLATLRFGQTNANRGIVWQQLHIAPATTLSELRRSGTSHASFQSDVLMTNWMSNMVGKQIFDIEVDSTNRVLFANTISSTVHNAPPSSVYNATTGADFGIRYFDYAGVAVPWTSVQTITTTAKPIALALDLNDDVLMIDITNVLHKYSKATGYTEVTTGGWPVDLKLAPYNLGLGGAGAGDKKVHDFIVDWRTRSIIILAQSQESATAAPGNGYLLRINCDLSVPTLPNGNPVRLLLTDSTSQALNADITIDQLDANGIALNSLQGSRQIAVLGNTNSTTVPDFYFYDTNLFLQGSMQGEGPNGTIKGSAATFNIHNNLTHTWDGSTNIAWQLWYRHGTGSVSTGNPPGWQ